MRDYYASSRINEMPWWGVLLMGLAAIIVGILIFMAPGMSIFLITQFLGIYWLVTGLISLISLFVDRSQWGWKLLSGILGILAGLLIVMNPALSTMLVPTVFVIVIGVNALLMGIVQTVQGFSGGGFSLVLIGILNILLSLILLFHPFVAALATPWVIGTLAIIGGILAAIGAFYIRGQRPSRPQPIP